MKVLLIKSSNPTILYKGMAPPLGLMYIASYIKEKRHDEVRILDVRLYKEPLKKVYDSINEFQPDIVGIGALTFESQTMYHIAHLMKRISDIPIIVGGPYATSVPEEAIKNKDIDIVAVGEGEVTFKELLDTLESEGDLNNVQSIVYKDNGSIKMNRSRDYIENLDELPFPAWDLIELKKYAKLPSVNEIAFRPYMILLTSRGCPFKCTYCHDIFGKKFRARSANNVLEEMQILVNQYAIKDLKIIDDIANFDRERIKSILEMTIKKQWKIRLAFPNGVRADMLDEEIIDLMRKAGTVEIAIAVETVSPRLQKMVKKNLHLATVKKMINICADSGMFIQGFFMLGFPTETEEEVKATINYACKSRIHEALFFLVNPFGGTELSMQVKSMGKIPLNVKSEDFDYHAMPFNASNVPDKKLHMLYIFAYIRFYFNPIRILRILKTKATWRDLPYLLIWLLRDLIAPYKGNKKIVFEPADISFANINHKHDLLKSVNGSHGKVINVRSVK